jgi:hypothetical protein
MEVRACVFLGFDAFAEFLVDGCDEIDGTVGPNRLGEESGFSRNRESRFCGRAGLPHRFLGCPCCQNQGGTAGTDSQKYYDLVSVHCCLNS